MSELNDADKLQQMIADASNLNRILGLLDEIRGGYSKNSGEYNVLTELRLRITGGEHAKQEMLML